jgi:hypothetical protein
MQHLFILRAGCGGPGPAHGLNLALQRLWLCGNAPFKRALKRRDVRVKGTAAFDGAADGFRPMRYFFVEGPSLKRAHYRAFTCPAPYAPRAPMV